MLDVAVARLFCESIAARAAETRRPPDPLVEAINYSLTGGG